MGKRHARLRLRAMSRDWTGLRCGQRRQTTRTRRMRLASYRRAVTTVRIEVCIEPRERRTVRWQSRNCRRGRSFGGGGTSHCRLVGLAGHPVRFQFPRSYSDEVVHDE
jgi:hypothetical protein